MKSTALLPTNYWLAAFGLVSALPATYFVTGSILKYELGYLAGTSIYPLSPAILLGGLLIAVVLNLFAVLRLHTEAKEGVIRFTASLGIRPGNLLVLALGAAILFILLGYVVVENLVSH